MKTPKNTFLVCAIASLILGHSSEVFATEFSITAERDNTIFSDFSSPPVIPEKSNGIGDHIFAGKVVPKNSGVLRRALLYFNLAGSGIPIGAKIKSVELTLRLSMQPQLSEVVPYPETPRFFLHRLISNWGEGGSHAPGGEGQGATAQQGDATWKYGINPSIMWNTEGGDFDPSPSGQRQVMGLGDYSWDSESSTDDNSKMVDDVQAWIDNFNSNFGWILIGEEDVSGSARRFDSKDNRANDALKPTLTIVTRECQIFNLSPVNPRTCSNESDTYTQDILVNYVDPPDTGFLVINDQEFEITGSPQIVTLTGLPLTGQQVNATAFFSANPNCSFFSPALFTAPSSCDCNFLEIRKGIGTPCNQENNFYTNGVIVKFEFPPVSGTLDINGQSFTLPESGDSLVLRDLISDGNPVDVSAQFSEDPECKIDASDLFTAPQPCGCVFIDIIPKNQTECNLNTNVYSQTLTIQFTGAPNTGNLIVNGQSFTFNPSQSEQTVTLVDLPADGSTINVTANFSDQQTCSITKEAVFTAPVPCPLCDPPDCTPIISLVPGWNLISLPVQPMPPNDRVDVLFSEVSLASPVWGWDGNNFESVTELKAFNGYWINLDGMQSIDIEVSGMMSEILEDNIKTGWNLIGLGTDNFAMPQNSFIDPRIWRWDGMRIQPTEFLRLMKGYWLFSSGDTMVDLSE